MLDAAKRASARHITAVMPYFDGQDKTVKTNHVFQSEQSLPSFLKLRTTHYHDGFTRRSNSGFFEKPVDHLFASTIFVPISKT